jgi:hypothetical protein
MNEDTKENLKLLLLPFLFLLVVIIFFLEWVGLLKKEWLVD